jgi:hypothetical protein
MTKLASKIATGLAVLALSAPAFALTQSTTSSGNAQTSAPAKAHRTHKKVAQADTSKSMKSDSATSTDPAAKADAKATKTKSAKKHAHSKKSHAKSSATSESTSPSSAPTAAPAK